MKNNIFGKIKYYLRSLIYGPDNRFTITIAIIMLILLFLYRTYKYEINKYIDSLISIFLYHH